MCPELQSKSPGVLANCSKFSWDFKRVSWTNGKEPQKEYADVVARWNSFYDLFGDDNSNKIAKKLLDDMLELRCSKRAKDFVKRCSDQLAQLCLSLKACCERHLQI